MNTKAHSSGSPDSTCMAYGEQVKELLSMSEPAVWVDHLWTIYGGYMLAQEELGRDKHASDISALFEIWCFSFRRWRKREGNLMVGCCREGSGVVTYSQIWSFIVKGCQVLS